MYLLRTIPQHEEPGYVEAFFDGAHQGEMNFSVPTRLRRSEELRYVALVYRGRVWGRLRVLRTEEIDQPVAVGNVGNTVNARTTVWVSCPGESAGDRNIPRESRRSVTYDPLPEWPE